MGASAKTLERIMTLTNEGAVPPGGAICDLGATELRGPAAFEGACSFLDFYAARIPGGRRASDVDEADLHRISNSGFLGELFLLAGFEYVALDIFHARNTILFDLNVHEPGPALAGRFDLVLNLGTTEHVLNQLLAFKTIHDLCKPAGVIYHDLPMAGYINHGLVNYNPMLFGMIAAANSYKMLYQRIGVGAPTFSPESVMALGFPDKQYRDVGFEACMQRNAEGSFRVPLETSTSLAIDPAFFSISESENLRPVGAVDVHYAAPSPQTVAVDAQWDVRNMTVAALMCQLIARVTRRLRSSSHS
jgi:SAM-dependent methyltransferase